MGSADQNETPLHSRDNVFRMRHLSPANRETVGWFRQNLAKTFPEVGSGKVGTASRQLPSILGDSISENMCDLFLGLSWSHQTIIIGAVAAPAVRYCAALDEQLRLPHENSSIGLVLCKSVDKVQVRLALTAAANKIGVASYQTALPDERLIQRRLEQLPNPSETNE